MKKNTQNGRVRKSNLAINVALVANAFLAIAKTSIGIIGHSPALLADGINSTSDVAYGIVVKIFMHFSAKPADEEHPYGHDRLESIATVVVGAFVMCTAISIFWAAINDIYSLSQGNPAEKASQLALIIAIFTIVLKYWLSIWTSQLGKQINNNVLLALAADHRNDILSSGAATLGIIGSRSGIFWIDPLAGAIVAGIILFTGIEIIRDAAADLMNTTPGEELKKEIRETLSKIPTVLEVEEISGHKFGVYMILDITIGINPDLSVRAGDEIATLVENTLITEIDAIRRVFVHYHPVQKSLTKSRKDV